MKYTVEIGGRALEIEISGGRVSVDGRPVEAQLAGLRDSAIRRLQRGAEGRTLVATRAEGGCWSMLVDGARVDAQVLTSRDLAIRTAARKAGGQKAGGILKAPMPGLVVRILVEERSSVEAGQPLLVLEAMKMETVLKAAGPGTVTTIHVTPGARVEKGAPLLLVS